MPIHDPSKGPRVRKRNPKVAWRVGQVRAAIAVATISDARIIERFSKEWKCEPRTIQGYLMQVRREMADEFEAMRPIMAGQLVEQMRVYYAQQVKAGKGEAAGRWYFDRMAKLCGADAAQKVELTGRDGAPIEIQRMADLSKATEEELAIAERFFGIARAQDEDDEMEPPEEPATH